MATLSAAATNTATTLTVDALPATEYVQVDDEIMEITAGFASSVYPPTGEVTPAKIRVRRGASGTTAAAHDNGAAVTLLYGASAGGGAGGVNVNDEPVTNIVAAGATVEDGEATLAEGGGLTNPVTEAVTITEATTTPLVVNGPPSADATEVVRIQAAGVDIWRVFSDGGGNHTIREDDARFVFERDAGGGAEVPGPLLTINEYNVWFEAEDGTNVLDIGREGAGGKIGFFDSSPAAQPAPIADATTEAEAVTQLNALLAAMRALGLIDT